MTILRAGVVGVGRWGRNHVRVLKELENEGLVKLVALCDVDMERLKSVAKDFGVEKISSDIREFARYVDIAIVATPIPTLAHIAKILIDYDIHVLIEKPVAESVAQALDLYAKARNKGVVAMPGFIMRFNPVVEKLKHIKSIDRVLYMIFRRLSRRPPQARRYDILLDLAIHDIDLCRYLNEGAELQLENASLMHGSIDDIVVAVIKTQGSRCLIHVDGLSLAKVREIEFIGENLFIRGNTDDLTIYVKRSDGTYTLERICGEEPLKKEVRNFIMAVKQENAEIPTLIDAIEALRVIERIRAR